jgi:DNA-binding NarL/FixJ family response regulator
MSVIRILLVDDHPLVRQSIRALLKKAADMEVVGEAQDGQDAIKQIKNLHPDIIIMDVSMPRLDGISATKRILDEDGATRILILSMHANESLAQQALQIGARGYLLKRSLSEELIPALRQVRQGKIVLSQDLA